MVKYSQKEKCIVRNKVLTTAIEYLTQFRDQITLTQIDYVSELKDYILKHGNEADKYYVRKLTSQAIKRWQAFYKSIVSSKKPDELKVAYLSGPNPENDLEILVKYGVLPENVWVFESNNQIYSAAVIAALASKYPFIKLHKGNICGFLNTSPVKFDIIYLDFLGPLPNRHINQKNLSVVTSLLFNHVLNSPGVLITNFSCPTKHQDAVGWQLLTNLISLYLYPKNFLEATCNSVENLSEGPIAHGLDVNKWLNKVRSQWEIYYGQYVTRLIIDLASYIVPYCTFSENKNYMDTFFNKYDNWKFNILLNYFYHFSANGGGGDVIAEPGQYPVLWTLVSLNKKRNNLDSNYSKLIFNNKRFENFADLFIRQLSVKSDSEDLISRIEKLQYLLALGGHNYYFNSKRFRRLSERNWMKEMHQFCDLFLFNQIQDLLIRQLSIPYHVNIDRIRRWTYVAKKTRMYVDLFVFDECRYLYDWLPTLDMLNSGMNDIERQLIYRFVLDSVNRHRRWYSPEFLCGGAIVGHNVQGFEAKILKSRKRIN